MTFMEQPMDPMNPSMTTAQDKRHSAYSISCRDAGRALRVALIEVKVTGESGRKGASGSTSFFYGVGYLET